MNNLRNFPWINWILLGLFSLITSATAGLGFGYIREMNAENKRQAITSAVELKTQFDLGKLDFQAGRYEIARQRFEYILEREPDYPDAMEYLTQTLFLMAKDNGGMNLDIPKISDTPIPTLIPTPDTRAIEEIFASAEILFDNKEWRLLGKTLLALRDNDPLYRVSEVDRRLYLAHYFNGIDKILYDGDLEGGLYDLSLAELFSPLDSQAEVYREWARLYQIGMSFWYVYPDRSAAYFSQLAAAAPYLQDLSGVPAISRYRMALVMYGEALAKGGDWCSAVEQYRLAQSIYHDLELESKVRELDEQCQYSIATPTFTPSLTLTPTASPTLSTFTWTATIMSSSTATIPVSLTPTFTITYGDPTTTSSLTQTFTSSPTFTPSPTGGTIIPTNSPTTTITSTSTETATPTETLPNPSNTVTATPTSTPIPTATPTPTPSSTTEP